MASSMKENNQEHVLHEVPMAATSMTTPVYSQYTPAIGSVPINHYGVTYHPMENDKQLTYLPTSTPLSNQSQIFKSHQTLSYTVPTTSTTTTLNCLLLSQYFAQLNCETSNYTLPLTPPVSNNPPFPTNEATYHKTKNNNQSIYTKISVPSTYRVKTFESHQTVTHRISTEHIATALNFPPFKQKYIELSVRSELPPTSTEATSAPFGTEASFNTQCKPSTSTQIFHKPISQPQDHVEDKKNKQSSKSTFDDREDEKSVVAPNDKRKHKCEYDNCGLLFLRTSHLESHIRSFHTGERPYICNHADDSNEICGTTFVRTDLLLRHERIHKGEAEHICHICSKGFTRSDHLNQHIRTHQNAGGRNYQQ